jgi:Mediator complex subunit 13 N-terminal
MTETPAQGATTQTIRNGPAHENFLSAVRALVEFTFLQKPEYQILGNWLIPPSTDDQGQDGLRLLLPSIYTPSPCRGMFKLNVNLAANGELYIAPERNSSILLQRVNAVPPPAEGTLLFLSPSGTRAEFVSILPSTSQTSPILQKIRMTTGLEAKFPLMRVRLTASGADTLWPVNLAFQKCASRNITSLDTTNYFNLQDGVSAAVKLISDALTYKPPPAPSPAIPPSVAAHVTPSGAYHTPPDGLTRTKPTSVTAQTPTINQNSQEDWITSSKDEDDIWPAVGNVRDEDETFMFDESGFDLQEEDFDFFDDEPSGETDDKLENLVSELRPPEEQQAVVVAEPKPQPMEEVKLERPSSPPPEDHESQMVLSPPYSPLRILPSPPPSKRGSFPRVWDHVRLSGNLEKLQDKYKRGGKYWCDDLDEDALEDDSMSESSSEDERVDVMATNWRKRKRDGDEDEGNSTVRINGPTIGTQNLDSDSISVMARAIDDNFLLLQNPRDDFIKRMSKHDERQGIYTTGLDTDEFVALAETVATQVAWDGLGAINNESEQDTISLDDFNSVVTEIWGIDAANNPGLKELTEVTDNLPSDEEESPQMKTPRMKPVRSSHSQPASTLALSSLEQTPSIYPIPPSSFLVHRIVNRVPPAPNHTQRLSVSQPALRFWEKFSFSPVAGEKDVQCYIVHPDSDGMVAATESFLSEIQTGWESFGMGKFERGKVSEGKDGMIAISVPPNAEEDMYLSAYEDALVAFGKLSPSHSY